MKFEDAIKELEKVVAKLESGEPDLEEALRLFEKGVGLARICETRLDQAETKVGQLLEGKDGESLSDFPEDEVTK